MLSGIHGAFKTAVETGKTDHYTIDQFVSMIIDAEWDERHNRRIERLIRNAKFHYKSNIEALFLINQGTWNESLFYDLESANLLKRTEML